MIEFDESHVSNRELPKIIRVKYLNNNLPCLKYNPKGDWIDVYASKDIFINHNESANIPLGFAMELPKGYEAHLVPRSSTFKTWGLIQTNSPGIIDNSYCGDNDEWSMPVFCLEPKDIIYLRRQSLSDRVIRYFDSDRDPYVIKKGTKIKEGDKIAQFRIVKSMPTVEFELAAFLGNPDRSGFGSTGTR